MKEITLIVERECSGAYVASWDSPDGKGGITTHGFTLGELQDNVGKAVACHFEDGQAPQSIRLVFRGVRGLLMDYVPNRVTRDPQ